MAREYVHITSGHTETKQPIFAVLVKRTYDIHSDQPAVRAEQTATLLETDLYYDEGDPERCTVKFENDLTPYKLATDVAIIGKAMAPGGRPVQQLSIGVEVAGKRKLIHVTGDRYCIHRPNQIPEFTDPVEFSEMELRYERAYGGKDEISIPDLPFHYPRNPLGMGLALRNEPEIINGLRLPNLEDPNDLLTPERVILGEPANWNQQPLPQGFGWFQKTWYPRCSFAGSVPGFVRSDTTMREEALGLVPENQIALARQFKLPSFDTRFNNGASIGMAFPYLQGNELIRLANLTPEHLLSFTLPGERPRLMLDIGLGENELTPVLHTVCIRLEDRQLDLIWRGAHPYPGVDWLPQMKRLHAEVD